jgi:hypothetical protein
MLGYLTFQLCVVFLRVAQQNDTQRIDKYLAAVHPELVEGQAKITAL